MSTATQLAYDLLDPILPDLPAGADMRWTPEWDRIREARRADDDLETGKWVKREHKVADWKLVQQLATVMLRERSKDLQLAMWLTEANLKLRGFVGLREGLHVVRELMVRYWDKGLFPAVEDGPEDRAGPFEWLNNKLVDSIVAIPITVRTDQDRDYSFIDRQDAQRVGSEAQCRTAHGDVDDAKKKAYDHAVAGGHVSLEMFDAAVAGTKRRTYEEFSSDFQQAYDEFKALEKIIDEKFGDVAPNLANCRTALSEIRQAVSDILEQKRRDEPDAPKIVRNENTEPRPEVRNDPQEASRSHGSGPGPQQPQVDKGRSWQAAEALIRSGQVDQGLQEMTRLAAAETTGRDRFQRKLLLAEICLTSKRDRLARSILEELAEQIDKYQLETWESSELVSSVWTRLYHIYKQDSETSELAGKYYERLCRLDPWQALRCNE